MSTVAKNTNILKYTCRKEDLTFRNQPTHIFRQMWFFSFYVARADCARGSSVGVCRRSGGR